ncbi:MAG TPA: hypothetical protein ENI32_07715 [Candidatus Syntrophoarchaeum butanivorans]|uniref:Uncharacterized protein n=1 Tax=Candidatus Syntropharchaeum butanivorans TaxID=1839936 RepID=A0A7J2S2Q2_9EURY|nr:hypothetical protein [Candidatus Syntrophoarchaeum butanivorans]
MPDQISPPDPGYEGSRFLAWLSKHGGIQNLKSCKSKCEQLGLNIDTILREWGTERIRINLSRGEKVVVLVDKVWAGQWTRYYDTFIPHHRHWKRI